MVGRPVGKNHEKFPIYGAYVVDSEYNEEEKQLEALLFVPSYYVQKVSEGLIDHVSVEYTWRSDKKTSKGTEFTGLNITRVDLIEGLEPGDSNAQVILFEAKSKRGKIIMEVKKEKETKKLTEGCVWSTKWDSPEACIAANQDKENPEAYCMSKVGESKGKEQEEPIPTNQEECEKKGWFWYEDACHKEPKAEEPKEESVDPEPSKEPTDTSNIKPGPDTLVTKEDCEKSGYFWDGIVCLAEKPPEPTLEELKEAFKKVIKENAKIKADLDKKLEEAKAESKEKVLKAVESKIPGNMVVSRFNFGARRLVYDLKKIIKETREK